MNENVFPIENGDSSQFFVKKKTTWNDPPVVPEQTDFRIPRPTSTNPMLLLGQNLGGGICSSDFGVACELLEKSHQKQRLLKGNKNVKPNQRRKTCMYAYICIYDAFNQKGMISNRNGEEPTNILNTNNKYPGKKARRVSLTRLKHPLPQGTNASLDPIAHMKNCQLQGGW